MSKMIYRDFLQSLTDLANKKSHQKTMIYESELIDTQSICRFEVLIVTFPS